MAAYDVLTASEGVCLAIAWCDGRDSLEMPERVAHEIDSGAFYRQCLGAFVGEDHSDGVE